MATLKEANEARARHADDLASKGAHGIGVDKGKDFGKSGWVVVAFVDPATKSTLPTSIVSRIEGKDIEVPLMIKKAAPFEAQ